MTGLSAVGYTPIFRISKGGQDITDNLEDLCIEVQVTSNAGGGDSDTCTITLDDRGWVIESPSSGEGGAELSILMGYREVGLYQMGTFKVSKVRYSGLPKKLIIYGNSIGFLSDAKSPVITEHENKTFGDIANEIAKSAGVRASIQSGLASRLIPFLNQHESPMHLLQRLERDHGALAKFSDGVLAITDRNSGQSVSGQYLNNFTVGPSDLAGWDIDESDRTSFSHTRAAYFDRDEYETRWLSSSVKGTSGPPFMIKRTHASQAEAQAAANSKQASLNRGQKTGTLTLTKGNAAIRGGSPFTIAGCRDGVDDDYIIETVVHTLGKFSGLTTVLTFNNSDSGSGSASNSNNTEETPVINAQGDRQSVGPGGIGHR